MHTHFFIRTKISNYILIAKGFHHTNENELSNEFYGIYCSIFTHTYDIEIYFDIHIHLLNNNKKMQLSNFKCINYS